MSGSSTDPPTGPVTVATVRERLDCVDDPELARSIVELEYVDRIDIDGCSVHVSFTLPTAWCSPAFAWMMAADARDEVESIPGVREAGVELHDHMHADEITMGVNARDGFAETFPDAEDGVTEVRATLKDKARLARQHEAVDALLDAGVTRSQIVTLVRSDLALHDEEAHVTLDGVSVVVDRDPLAEYVRRAEESGYVTDLDDILFRTPDGDPIPRDRFETVQKRARLAEVNIDGQGAVCDALHEARHGPRGSDGPST